MGQKFILEQGGMEMVAGDCECLKEFKVISKWEIGELMKLTFSSFNVCERSLDLQSSPILKQPW